MIDLNECWCCEMNKLVNISISKENLHFNLYDGLMIEKVDESGSYEEILKNASIPSNIMNINPYSFFLCNNIETINFLNDSSLISIYYSNQIKTLFIRQRSFFKIVIEKHFNSIRSQTHRK